MQIFRFNYNAINGYRLYSENNEPIDSQLEMALYEKAFPSGKTWRRNEYINQISLRNFIISPELFGVSYTTVTNERDKIGNKGILESKILVLDSSQYYQWLVNELESYPKYLPLSARILNKTLDIMVIFKRIRQLNFFDPIKIIFPRDPSDKDDADTKFLFLSLQRLSIDSSSSKFIEFSSLSLDWKDSVKFVAVPNTELGNIDKRRCLVINYL